MPRFATFDRRNYRTVSAREGYALWAATFEDTIKRDMDLWLRDEIQSVRWSAVEHCADLGCGTGRTAAWLASRGVRQIDGVDATPEMLDRARQRGVFASLRLGDVCATGLPATAYDLVTTCLVDEQTDIQMCHLWCLSIGMKCNTCLCAGCIIATLLLLTA